MNRRLQYVDVFGCMHALFLGSPRFLDHEVCRQHSQSLRHIHGHACHNGCLYPSVWPDADPTVAPRNIHRYSITSDVLYDPRRFADALQGFFAHAHRCDGRQEVKEVDALGNRFQRLNDCLIIFFFKNKQTNKQV